MNLPGSLTARAPKAISVALIPYYEQTLSHVSGQGTERIANWFWFKLAYGLRLGLQPPEGSWIQFRSPARWS
jgi:hypothetical protein